MIERRALRIAYLHYGAFSGVTDNVITGLRAVGHEVVSLEVVGPLEPRNPRTRAPNLTWPMFVGLAASLLRHGRRVLAHRWNTPFAFDFHSRRAGELVDALSTLPDLLLQNGALFAPGRPPSVPYALLLDHTRALSMRHPPMPEAGLPAPLDYGRDWNRRETATYQGATLVATFSQRVRDSVVRDYGVPFERTIVTGGGANVWPVRIERKDDGCTFLFVGKDFRRKGGRVLLEAFRKVRRVRPDARLWIAGPRERLDLPEGAEQLGPVPMDRLGEVFAKSTVFVMPTLKEPYGLAFLDAMANGRACIGTRVEAVPEIIEDGETGLLVAPGNAAELADAMVALLNDPDRARRMGELGRVKVDLGGRWHHAIARLDTALQERLASHATAHPSDESRAPASSHR